MRSLKAAGTSIVFITHKLKEVKAIADRIVATRSSNPRALPAAELAALARVPAEAVDDPHAALAGALQGKPLENWRDWSFQEIAFPYRTAFFAAEAAPGLWSNGRASDKLRITGDLTRPRVPFRSKSAGAGRPEGAVTATTLGTGQEAGYGPRWKYPTPRRR